jgi:hypothetical protein
MCIRKFLQALSKVLDDAFLRSTRNRGVKKEKEG